jgi:aquaporin Z
MYSLDTATKRRSATAGLRWAEYLIEAAALASFMIAAIVVTAILEHPTSPVHAALPDALVRRALAGVAMGLTAAAIIYSRWGQRSGAHMNPVVTLTFLRLGKVTGRDAACYVASQFAGGIAGVVVAAALLGGAAASPPVNYAATVPGPWGATAALAAEAVISFGMMTAVLHLSNSRFARYTGIAASSLVALYITVEAPVSGMSMNPARSLGSAAGAGGLQALWIYFVAPAAGMLAAGECFVRQRGHAAVRCAKLHHPASGPCHFNCVTRTT